MPVTAAVIERQDRHKEGKELWYQRHEEDIDDADLEVWDDANYSHRGTTPSTLARSESSLTDVLNDLRSQRWRYFFSVRRAAIEPPSRHPAAAPR